MRTKPERLSSIPQEAINEDQQLTLTCEDNNLLTDLYELTMAACYAGEGVDQQWASFELFTRKLPENYGYLIAMGLAQALDFLEHFHFSSTQIEALRSLKIFANAPQAFWSLLENAKFTGNVWAVLEGTAIFPNEPLLRVEAPLWQAQIVETFLLNTLNYQTLIATRAARLRDVAGSKAKLLEFGTRRAFSPQASVWAVRAALAAGLDSTSNVLAALKLGREPVGTMAHSLVMAVGALEGGEDEAFAAFERHFPGSTLLIDTYDTVEAARRLAEKINQGEMDVKGVRLDSGDLASLSKQVRSLLPGVSIFASGDIDEYEIARLNAENAEIDGYGMGTKLVSGTPVNGVYKLVEVDDHPVMKKSSGKVTYPGRKQIIRTFKQGQIQADCLILADEERFEVESENGHSISQVELMQLMVKAGERMVSPEPLETIAKRTAASVASLSPEVRRLDDPISFEVNVSEALTELTERVRDQI
ncbi:nicotinate phosphoribosyltransferase [Lyngbya aestuarii]|uniref:nicotinate phosphoribosyltransferase n=1 Tax=Lyngbya aestuarii TaxID=118322 RepID=UPI0003FC0519|nr:nicotinate phosphoribosyltransferase [Lyngbya aestuarii]